MTIGNLLRYDYQCKSNMSMSKQIHCGTNEGTTKEYVIIDFFFPCNYDYILLLLLNNEEEEEEPFTSFSK